jgi:hypothetical protein
MISQIEDSKTEKGLEYKCEGVNLGKQSLHQQNANPEYSKILAIAKNNYMCLQEKIQGPYRFGCI